MFPRLWQIGNFTLPTYGVLLATAYLVAIWWASRKGPARGISSDDVSDLGIWVLISSLIGSKALLFALTPKEFLSLSGLVRLLQAGGVFYGGLIAASATGLWMLHRRRLPLWKVADLAAPSIALGEAIGRVGCLAAGCCYGKPTDLPWAIVFTDPFTHATIGTPLNIPLHPTQIYLSLDALSLFILLEVIDRRWHRFDGHIFWIYVLVHSILRSIVEIFRGDQIRGFLIPDVISTSQAIAAVTALAALAMLVVLSKRRKTSPAT